MTPEEIISAIRAARQAAGMTQATAATKIGWKQPVWAEYESGRKVPGLAVAERMAKAVGLTLKIEHTQEK